MTQVATTTAPPPTEASPTVRLQGVRKTYDGYPVLEGIHLDAPAGQLTAILGASGCGKTTLLRLIAGFDTLDTGQITLAGRTIDDGTRAVPPGQRRIGYVPQEGALFPHLSVAANIGFGLPRRPHRQRHHRVRELLEMVGLAELADRAPHQLSGGQQQRVALARALAPRPHLVLLDEPFSALDPALRAQLRHDLLTLLRTTATTAILVTHDQNEALSTADHLAVLHQGHIAQAGQPITLYRQPTNPTVARLTGQVNLLHGRIDPAGAHCELGTLPVRPGGPRHPAPALIMIRPEQIHLETFDRTTAHPNTVIAGKVLHQAYHGHHTSVTIQPRDHPTLRLIARTTTDLTIHELIGFRITGTVTAWPSPRDNPHPTP